MAGAAALAAIATGLNERRQAYLLAAYDEDQIRQQFNVVLQRTVLELKGLPCLDLERDSWVAKTICSSRSFGHAVGGVAELAEALTT